MYVVVQHRIKDPDAAFERGQKLITGEGAPEGCRSLQFYPSDDRSAVACLFEAGSLKDVEEFVDSTLGDASENAYFAVDAEHAYSEQPLGLAASRPAPVE
ncbi:MAG: hypothetical protein ACM3QU_07080 [Verrucomicrobiota bacterium]